MIDRFTGEYRFLSNFYEFLKPIPFLEWKISTAEHLYQAFKATSLENFKLVLLSPSASKARRNGRKIPRRKDWDIIKFIVMEFVLRLKFRIPELREKLLATGDEELQEGNFWGDEVWGVSFKTGEGKNHLGKLLMKLREEYQLEQKSESQSS